MSKHKPLEKCRKSEDFIDYAIDHGERVRNGHGSHVVVCTDNGSCPIPHHGNQELQTGLCHKIMKIFTLIGLGVMLVYILMYL